MTAQRHDQAHVDHTIATAVDQANQPDQPDQGQAPRLVQLPEGHESAGLVPVVEDGELLDPEPAAEDAPAGLPVLDAEAVDLPAVVDPPAALVPARRVESRPVVPGWLRSREQLRSAAGWHAHHAAHVAAFHGLRVPLYGARLAGRAPVGAGRLVGGLARWATDADGRAMRSAMTSHAGVDPAVFVRLTEQRRQLVHGRLTAAGVGALTVGLGGWLAVSQASGVGLAVLALVVVVVLGVLGRSPDHPVTSRAVDAEAVPRLTSDLILTALGSLGIGELNKALAREGKGGDTAVRFPAPITRDGPGFRCDIDLPPGVTAGDVVERRDRLASGLRRPLGAVWPEADHDTHAGRLVLWVGDKPMGKTKPVPWPLAKAGRVDLFTPFPIGTDPRGRPVTITLMFALMVIGAMPRMGKTFTLRLLLLAAALDPRCELHPYDLKGGADFLPLEPVAHRFRIGDDPDDIAYLLADLRELHKAMQARYKTLRGLSRQVCPEGKVTPELAGRRDLKLWPVLVALDECQIAFEHEKHGAEIEALVTDLGKRGPAAGMIVIAATQRPDAKSLPTGISSNAALRFCLKVAGQVENDMVLGTSAYKNGTRATTFARTDRGVGYLAGEGEDPVIVRTAFVDGPAAELIVARARAARLAAGLLTGHAAGLDPDPDESTASVLDHLAAVWPPADDQGRPADRVWWDELAERLAATYPGLYAGWQGDQVSAATRPHGLAGVQIKRVLDGRQVNRRGLARADLNRALADRDDQAPTELAEGDPA